MFLVQNEATLSSACIQKGRARSRPRRAQAFVKISFEICMSFLQCL